jgi:hypothetical protein
MLQRLRRSIAVVLLIGVVAVWGVPSVVVAAPLQATGLQAAHVTAWATVLSQLRHWLGGILPAPDAICTADPNGGQVCTSSGTQPPTPLGAGR